LWPLGVAHEYTSIIISLHSKLMRHHALWTLNHA
jgi:hypothetical protein